MTRVIVQMILPLIAPFIIYCLWLFYSRKRAKLNDTSPPAFTRGGAFVAILVGALFAFAGFAYLAITGGASPDSGMYTAPKWEDGKIIGPTYGE